MGINTQEVQKLINMGHLPYPVQQGEKIPAFAKGERAKYIPDYRTKALTTTFAGIGVFPQNGVNWVDYDLLQQSLIDKGFSPEVAQEIFERIDPLAQQILSQAIVARCGSKGFAAAFIGDQVKKSAIKIWSPTGKDITVIDLLAGHGAPVVIPPTMHPDTNKPYYWLTERTLYDTAPQELTTFPSDLVDQIRSIVSEYTCKKEHKKPVKVKKGKSGSRAYGLASNTSGSLPQDTLITLDRGIQVTLKEAMEKYQGEYCADPFEPHEGSQKAHVNGWGIYSHLGGGKRYYPAIVELKDHDVTCSVKNINGIPKKISEANKHSGDELAKWAYEIGGSVVPRLGFDLPPPSLWLQVNFPKLSGKHFKAISKHLNWSVSIRLEMAMKPLKLTPERYGGHIHLKRGSDGKFNFEPVKLASDKFKAVFAAAGHGSGKTQDLGVGLMKDSSSGMVMTHLESLTHQLSNTFRSDHYKSVTERESFIITTTINSINNEKKVRRSTNNVTHLLIDEASQVRQAIATTPFNSENKRLGAFERIREVAHCSDKVFFLDADITDIDIDFWCSMSGISPSEVLLVTAEDKVSGLKAKVNYVFRGGLKGFVERVQSCMSQGGKPVVFCESKDHARKIFKTLKEKFPNRRIENISSGLDSSHETGLFKDPCGHTKKLDCLIHTSKLGSGFSIEHDTAHFTQGFCLLSGACLTPQQAIQGMRRVRYINFWDITVATSNGLSYSTLKETKHSSLSELMVTVRHEKAHSKALFAAAFNQSLINRGFEVVVSNDWASGAVFIKDITAEDIACTIAAKEIPEPHARPIGNDQWYENYSHECRNLFGVVNESTASALLKSHAKVSAFAALSGKKACDESQVEIMAKAQDIFRSMLKDKLSQKDCREIMRQVVTSETELKILDLLPERWVARRVPSTRPRANIAHLAISWGLEATCENEHVVIEVSDVMRLIYSPDINPAGKVSRDKLIVSLKEQGFSQSKIAQKVGVSEDTVKRTLKRLIKNSRAKTPVSVKSINTTYDAKGVKCPGNNNQSSTVDTKPTEPVETTLSIEGNADLGTSTEGTGTLTYRKHPPVVEGDQVKPHGSVGLDKTPTKPKTANWWERSPEIPKPEPVAMSVPVYCPFRELKQSTEIEVLADDIKWLKEQLRLLSKDIQRERLQVYRTVWVEAMNQEPPDSASRQNSGRYAANCWLRSQLKRPAVAAFA